MLVRVYLMSVGLILSWFSELGLVVQGVAHWFGQTCKRDVGAGPLAYMLAHLLALLALPLYIFFFAKRALHCSRG